MNICDDGHDEIVFDSKYCPLCQALSDFAELEKEIVELKDEIQRLEPKE